MTEEEAPSSEVPATAEDANQAVISPDEELKRILKESPPCVDLKTYQLKIDHFDQMHTLGKDKVVDGAPNFRQVKGFPVFGTAQPTASGFKNILSLIPKDGSRKDKEEKAEGEKKEKKYKIIWYNMRQEPVVYINGIPYAPRHPEKMHENMEVENPSVEELENLQNQFMKLIKIRKDISGDSTLKVHKDADFTENPMDREDVQESIKVKDLKSLNDYLAALRVDHDLFEYIRNPVVEERAPVEDCFDVMVNSLKNEPASTQCIFSCQMGRGRTTLGMVVACLIKEIQVSTELRKMADIDLISKETIDKLINQQFESPLPKKQDDDDALIKGEFDVIKELLQKEPAALAGKKKIDRIMDICGPSPKGTGLQNLRECIIETKWKYDVAPEEKQVVWKQMILNFMERYFYLICFSTYAMEVGPTGFQISFKSWMDQRPHLRTMIDEGKDKLEWYRQVDPAKLNTLKDLINAPNYKENLGTLIKTIYEFAFLTYADLPRGDIKNNSMRKLAAKTLMEILPPDIGDDIQKKLDEQCAGHDFVTLIGLVSFHGREQEATS